MTSLPPLTVLKVEGVGWLKYVSDEEIVCATGGEGVFELFSKIEVERANITGYDYFHLRFYQNNKYWARGADAWVVANSTKPEEDRSNPSCTLFESYIGGFRHVQSGGLVNMKGSGNRLYVDDSTNPSYLHVTPLDSETFLKLPKRLAFKGDNEKYLGGVVAEGYNFLQFGADDVNNPSCGYEIYPLPDGRVAIKSDYFNNFFNRNVVNSLIFADSKEGGVSNPNTLFWPVKIDDNTVALRNDGNQRFCARFSDSYYTNDLSAAVATIMKEARLGVVERVLERKVYNVVYKMEEARIYNQQPFVAGTAEANNLKGTHEASIDVEIKYEDSRSYTFSRSMSFTGGVTVTFNAGILGIAKEGFEMSFEVNETSEWSNSTTITKSVTATGSVTVPAGSVAHLNYVGTLATCDVPFTYTIEDRSSVDGSIVRTEEIDGIFTGVNAYNFSFEFVDDEIK